MTTAEHKPHRALIQSLASAAPISWLLARGLHRLDKLALRVSRGRWSLTGLLAGAPVVMVTSTGARTGKLRTSPLLCIWDKEHPGSFGLIASNWGQRRLPAWYFNIKAHPNVTCCIDGRGGNYTAREAAGEEYDRFWRYATETYGGYLIYRQRAGRRIPIMVLSKVGE